MKRIFISILMIAAMVGMASCACSSNSAEGQAENVECTSADCASCSDCETADDACASEGYSGCDSTAVKDTSCRR